MSPISAIDGRIVALLGPTNTGKTYVAIQRMLGHRSGMIGLPLRLLAREVYETLVAARGEDAVALVTGEEKRVPRDPRYWVCTVESMPTDRPVAFLAVDEVQLAGDPWRGHVFTDRILHARGVKETWFLGSDTVAPLLQQLVPTVEVRTQPRLSKLSYAGPRKLTSLPPRSAVVTFSMREVYQLAERLRARTGGTAVVMGALSPRARNAQVELYQSGAVQHMVATDAIGMGLNLDLHHVALAATTKFDGRQVRALRPDELAQIAGRAGRWRRDGTFGVTHDEEPLDPELVGAIEAHAFAPLRRLYWRNGDLDLSTPYTLLEGLRAPSPRRFLKAVHDADDARALVRMLEEDEVTARAVGRDRVQLLWEVARIPDFGNTLAEHHAQLLAKLYVRLVDGGGMIDDAWLGAQVARVDRTDGDVETLMARIASIRIWTTLVHHAGWVGDAQGWVARVRAVEDRLSDALHDKLTARFVDTRASVLVRHLELDADVLPELSPGGRVLVGGQLLGRLRGLRFVPEAGARPSPVLDKAVRRVLAPLLVDQIGDLVASPDGAFGLDIDGALRWDGAEVARLLPGDDWRSPRLRMLRHDALTSPQRQAVSRRLDRWWASWRKRLLEPLTTLTLDSHPARAVAHALEAGLGLARRPDVADLIARLSREDRQALRAVGIRIGRRWVWHHGLMQRTPARAALAAVHVRERVSLPDAGGRMPFDEPLPRQVAQRAGFERLADLWVRVDTLEAVLDGAGQSLGVPEAQVDAIRAAARPPPRSGRRGGGRRRRR